MLPDGRKIGEVWFTAGGAPLPLLMKFIFTSERLSVQVHPNDEYAARVEHSKGQDGDVVHPASRARRRAGVRIEADHLTGAAAGGFAVGRN